MKSPLTNVLFVQPPEDGVQFPGLFVQGGQFLLTPPEGPLYLCRLPAADILRELPGVLPGLGGHPPQVLQHHLIQDTLPDVVGCADLAAVFFIGPADEVAVGGRHGVCPVKHHGLAAVGAHHQSGVFVLLLHLGPPVFVPPHPLDDVPGFPVDERLMAALNHQAFLPGVLHVALVLVGPGAVLHVDGVAQVQLVLQHIGHSAAGPVVWLLRVQAGVTYAGLPVGIGRRAQHLFPLQHPGDLAGTVSGGAQGEDPTDYRPCLFVNDQLLLFVFSCSHRALWYPAAPYAPPWPAGPPGSSGWCPAQTTR